MISKDRLKDALYAILIGAVVAFVTTFLEGALEYMQGLENNIAGGVSASVIYALKHIV